MRWLAGGSLVGAVSAISGWQWTHRAAKHGNGHAVGTRARRQLAGEVRQACEHFHTALDRLFVGDLAPMEAVWSHSDDVTLMDPFGGRNVGWRQVRGLFERGARLTTSGHVEPRDLLVRTDGDVAYALCVEQGWNVSKTGERVPVRHRATSIFRRVEGEWKMVHHHTDEAVALQGTLGYRG